jgi:hypothetical protein
MKLGQSSIERDPALLFLKSANVQQALQRFGDGHGYTAAASAPRRSMVSAK